VTPQHTVRGEQKLLKIDYSVWFDSLSTCGGSVQATNVGSIPIARSTFFSKELAVPCRVP